MITNRDIVVIGIQPWDVEIGSNCKNIAVEFAKHNRVLYVNSPLERISALKEKNQPKTRKRLDILNGKQEAIKPISENLWEFYPRTIIESINRLPLNPLFDFLNRLNTKRYAKEINKALNELNFKNIIVFNDSSMFLGNSIKEFLDADAFVYYIRDNLVNSPFPYWNTHGKRIEPDTISKADVVVTNSLYYQEYAAKYNKNSYMVGQGCDLSLFEESTKAIKPAEDLKDIQKPIIGYVGNIASIRLDIELLEYVAKEKPEWQIVLVGPEDDAFKTSKLHQQSNVHFLGSRPMENLPEYIKAFDVCINPQVVNNTTIGNYPRKIDEYLAMGKPVVATYTKAMEYFKDHTYLAHSKEEFITLISKALKDNSDVSAEKRKEFAKTHSWENNVKDIYKSLLQVKPQ